MHECWRNGSGAAPMQATVTFAYNLTHRSPVIPVRRDESASQLVLNNSKSRDGLKQLTPSHLNVEFGL